MLHVSYFELRNYKLLGFWVGSIVISCRKLGFFSLRACTYSEGWALTFAA
jgi:hypothetical protein